MTIADTFPDYVKNYLLQPEIVNDSVVPGKYIVFFQGYPGQGGFNTTVWTRIHVNSMIDTIQNHCGPDGDIWVALLEKAYAYFRTTVDTFHSLDYGYPTTSYMVLGLTSGSLSVGNVNSNIQNTLNALKSGECLTLCTGGSPVRGLIASHVYGFRNYAQQPKNGTIRIRNPWGPSGAALEIDLTPADLADRK